MCDLKHTSPSNKHKWRGPTHKANDVILAPRVVTNDQVPMKELMSKLKMDYRRYSNYKQMLRGKDLVCHSNCPLQCFFGLL